eukprot:5067334-Prymnesium_polylepis.2
MRGLTHAGVTRSCTRTHAPWPTPFAPASDEDKSASTRPLPVNSILAPCGADLPATGSKSIVPDASTSGGGGGGGGAGACVTEMSSSR